MKEGMDFMQALEPEKLETIAFPIGDAKTAQPPASTGVSETSCDGKCKTRPMEEDAGSIAQWHSEEVRTIQAAGSDKQNFR